jgi:hypothetical protein
MDVIGAVATSAVVTLVGLILVWLGKDRFDAQDQRIERFEQHVDRRFEGMEQYMDRRFGGMEQFLDRRFEAMEQRIDRVDHRFDVLQGSVDAMRSDLTQVALAVGVRPRATNG